MAVVNGRGSHNRCLCLKIEEYIGDPETAPSNRLIAQSYQAGVESSFMIQPSVFPHYIPHKPDMSFYRATPCDFSQSCDLTRKEYSWSLRSEGTDHEPE